MANPLPRGGRGSDRVAILRVTPSYCATASGCLKRSQSQVGQSQVGQLQVGQLQGGIGDLRYFPRTFGQFVFALRMKPGMSRSHFRCTPAS